MRIGRAGKRVVALGCAGILALGCVGTQVPDRIGAQALDGEGAQALELSAAASEREAEEPVYDFSVRAENYPYGPGEDNLSAGDPYSIYQWGLRNDGQLQYMEVVNRFRDSNPRLAVTIDLANMLGIPAPVEGPSAYELQTTRAVPGVDINIQPAWKLYDASDSPRRPVVVAVIDTGVDINHPELKDSIWVNEDEIPDDGIDNDGNGYIDDVNGWNFFSGNNQVYVGREDDHGTHAAGTIIATRSRRGIAGIADGRYVKVMPIKALGSEYGVGEEGAVVNAIRYAEANGASICNLSFGTEMYYPQLEQVMRNSHMLFVISAGNGDKRGVGLNAEQHPDYPASFNLDNTIAVANLMFDGKLAESSNYSSKLVDIAAPGTYIVSTTAGNSYGFMTGTSMAAPMVTGVAALLYSFRTDISLSDVKPILMNTARKLPALEGKLVSGGMVDAYGALTYGLQLPETQEEPEVKSAETEEKAAETEAQASENTVENTETKAVETDAGAAEPEASETESAEAETAAEPAPSAVITAGAQRR